jgi:predicted TPR repeat methyltransferase
MTMTKPMTKSFDAAADQYDALVKPGRYFAPEWITTHSDQIGDRNPFRVLDLGCGTGLNIEVLSQRRPGIHAEGVDLSPRMLGRARATGRYERLYTHDLNEPLSDVASDSFDLVIAFGCLEFLSDVRVCLSECGRLLKTNGQLWASFKRFEADDPGSPPRSMLIRGVRMYGYSAAEILHMMNDLDMHVIALEALVGYVTRSGFDCPYNVLQARKSVDH